MAEQTKTIVLLKDSEIPFRDVVVKYKAKYAWASGKKYVLPLKKWTKEIKEKSLTNG